MEDQDNAPKIYCNNVSILKSVYDFAIQLNLMNFNAVADTQAVVYMSPQHVKAFNNILTQQVAEYEKQNGVINIPLEFSASKSLPE